MEAAMSNTELVGVATSFALALEDQEQSGLNVVASVDDDYPAALVDELGRRAPPNDVDRTMLRAGAVGIAWGLHQIRRSAPRLFAAIAFLFVVAYTASMIWFTVELVDYVLTTPACAQRGTCAPSQQQR